MTPEVTRKQNNRRWVLWVALAIALAAVVIYLLVWYGPDVIARQDIGSVTGPLRVFRMQQARDAARGRLLTLGAGLFAAAALIFTARNSIFLQRTVQLTEQGQVTDRYTRAIEQLGSDKLDVRIGGIYALERVARDSPRDHPTVMEVLTAFVREHSHEPWPPAEPAAGQPARATRPDIQAAVTAIGRRNSAHDQQLINLATSELPRADLSSANLDHADLHHADLAGVDLPEAHLTSAQLVAADLTGANLLLASLSSADLLQADLTQANLRGADLSSANLDHADLAEATLDLANLDHADLKDANLTDASLSETDLTRALLSRANLTRANLAGANLTHAYLAEADLTDARLTAAILADAYLVGALWPPDEEVPSGWRRDTETGRLFPTDTRPGGD